MTTRRGDETEEMEVRDRRDAGWFWSNNDVIDVYGSQIGAYGVAVYMVLAKHSNRGVCFPSVATIAELLHMAPNTVRKTLQTLKTCGLISIESRPGSSDTAPQSNLYQLLPVPKQRGTAPREVPPSPDAVRTSPREVPVLHHVQSNKTNKNKTKEQAAAADPASTPPPQNVEKSTIAAAASPRRVDGLDTETHKVVVRLMKLGMSEQLACRAIEANAFDDATLKRLEEWSVAKKREGRMSPGAWLNARLPHGILPDDLPVPPPEKRPAIELVWLEPIGGGSRIAVPSTIYEANPERYAHMEEV